MGTMYQVYRYNPPTELVFSRMGRAYNAGTWRYGAACSSASLRVRKTAGRQIPPRPGRAHLEPLARADPRAQGDG